MTSLSPDEKKKRIDPLLNTADLYALGGRMHQGAGRSLCRDSSPEGEENRTEKNGRTVAFHAELIDDRALIHRMGVSY